MERLITVALAIAIGGCGGLSDAIDATAAVFPKDGAVANRDATRPGFDAFVGGRDAGGPDSASPVVDARVAEPDVPADCPLGAQCRPILVERFPFVDQRDTRDGPSEVYDAYACAPDVDESGPEWFYEIRIDTPGVLTAELDDIPSDGIDVDLHLLEAPDPNRCLARDNIRISRDVGPGTYTLVADTWVDGDGMRYPGPYTLRVEFRPQAVGGVCATEPIDLRMFWQDCAAGVDCYAAAGDDGVVYQYLRTPATGRIAKEAHLVTDAENFDGGWPEFPTDRIQRHYDISEQASGFETDRREPWAPAGEGGSMYGQGSTGRPVPVAAEAWYVNMYWRDRPAMGTRMIVRNPATGHAVVAAAGFETGPGANDFIGGAAEEIHDDLGTNHGEILEFGFAVDQSLPYGPIDCD